MARIDFWKGIYGSGHHLVDPPLFAANSTTSLASAEDEDSLRAAIEETDALCRSELAGNAPPLIMPATLWALDLAHGAAQLLAFRELDEEAITQAMSFPCPLPPAPDVCYSIDLALCVLPDLIRLARAISPEDPLVKALESLARQWPLSSVSVPVEHADVAAFVDDPALRTLYADRILERGDVSRLDDARVVAEIRITLGEYPDLAPIIAQALQRVNP